MVRKLVQVQPPETCEEINHTDAPSETVVEEGNMQNADENQNSGSGDFSILNNDDEPSQSLHFSKPFYKSPAFFELFGCGSFSAAAVIVHKIPIFPNEREIPVQYLENSGDYVVNQTYNEPLVEDTVSNLALILVGFIMPFLLQYIICYWKSKNRQLDLHNTACVYMLSFGITILATVCVKLYAGYLRPIFFDGCEPDQDYQECTAGTTEQDYRKSFPSGHASGSFCGLTLLTLFLHTRFGAPSRRVYKQVAVDNVGDVSGVPAYRWVAEYQEPLGFSRLISILALLPMALALFIAASRVHDNKHFPADVVGGSVLGAAIAIYVNGLWFP